MLHHSVTLTGILQLAADGWKRFEPFGPALQGGNSQLNDISHTVILTGGDDDDEMYASEDCELAAKKRKKDHCRNNTDSQCFYRENWIYVHKESTRERHAIALWEKHLIA